MAGVSGSSIRHLTCRSAAPLRGPQRRWARVHDVRFVATQHAQERITDRYRHKLDQKAREQGLNDIGQLKEIYKEKIDEFKKKATVPAADTLLSSRPPSTAKSPWPSPPPSPTPQANARHPSSPSKSPPGLKTLSSFIDIPKTLTLPQKEIEAIWRLRHAHSVQSLCATMKTYTYESIAKTARQHPQFILPGLPRRELEGNPETSDDAKAQEGVPIHFMQWAFPAPDTATVMFTHLAEYKIRGEHSQPHTTLTHHLELAGAKGLVLCQGTVLPDRGVSLEEAKWLVMNMQKFYNTTTEVEEADESQTGRELKKRRRQLIEMFSQGHGDFKLESLLEEAERMG